jgi:hypothetical protein
MFEKIERAVREFSCSYKIYIGSTLILLPVYLLFNKLGLNFSYIGLIIVLSFLVAFMLDVFRVLKVLWKTTIGKFIYSIFGYFAYTFSESLAKISIYSITHENPDLYSVSTKYLAGWFMIPSWIIKINEIVIYLLFVSAILLPILSIMNETFLKKYITQFFALMKISFTGSLHNIAHSIYTFLTAGVFLYWSMTSLNLFEKIFNDSFISNAILKYSYYPNKTCFNIPNNEYIKLLPNNQVSRTHISQLEYFLLNMGSRDKKIDFETTECKRSK